MIQAKRIDRSSYPKCNCGSRARYRIEVDIEETNVVFVHFACARHLEKELNYLQEVRETYPHRNARVTVVDLSTMKRQGFVEYGDGRLNDSTTDEDEKRMQEQDLRISGMFEQLFSGVEKDQDEHE